MKCFYIWVYFMVGNILFSNGQTISGIVKDSSDDTPVAGVNIVMPFLKKGTGTNARGEFFFKNVPAGEYELHFSFVGMKDVIRKVKVEANKDLKLEVYMQMDMKSLDQVVVAAKGERKEIHDVKRQGTPVAVIDGKQLAGRGTTITEVLNHQTGVKLRQTGGVGNQTKVNIRGLEGNRVQIYMDGYALNTPDGSFSINDIPLQFIDRVEIYKGIVPPEFGGDGLGSAVNVVTIDAEHGYYDLSYSYQSYGVHNPTACISHYFDKANMAFTLFAGGTLARNDYTITSPYVNDLKIKRDHDRLKMGEFGATLKFPDHYFDKAELEFVGYYSYKETQGIQTNIRHARTKIWTAGVNPKLEKKHFLFGKLDLKFNGMVTYTHTALIDTSSFLYDFYGGRVPNTYGGEVGYVPNLSDDGMMDYRYNLNLQYHLIPDRMLVNMNNDFRYVSNETRDTVADRFLKKDYSGLKSNISGMISSVALQNKWFQGRLTSVLTGRHYYYRLGGKTVNLAYPGDAVPVETHKSDQYWGYSLALKYDLSSHWLVKFALEHNFRLPRYEEALGDRVTTLTSTELKAEQANNYNLGIMFDRYYNANSRLQFESNGYIMQVKNMMYLTSVVGYSKYQNLGEALLYGVDGEIKWDIDRNWFVSFNATWQKSLDYSKYIAGTNTESETYKMQLPHIPILFFNWMLDYRKDNPFGGKGQYARAYYEGGYTDKYYYGYELSRHQDYKIPSACLHTVGLEYGIMNRKVLFGVECHNLFDTDEMTNFNYPLVGRTVMAKLRFTTLKW